MTRCECGNPRSKTAAQCDRCGYLDGRFKMQRRIIEELRLSGGAAMQKDIAASLGDFRYVSRALRDLEQMGRVVRRLIEIEESPHPANLVILTCGRDAAWQPN